MLCIYNLSQKDSFLLCFTEETEWLSYSRHSQSRNISTENRPVALEGFQNDQHLLLNDWLYDRHGCQSVTPTCCFTKPPYTHRTLPGLWFHCLRFPCFYHLSIVLPLFLYLSLVGSECLCPPDIHMLTPSPLGDSIGRWASRRWLGCEGKALMYGIGDLIKEALESFLAPSAMWGYSKAGLSPDPEIYRCHNLGFTASRTTRDKCLLFISHPACGFCDSTQIDWDTLWLSLCNFFFPLKPFYLYSLLLGFYKWVFKVWVKLFSKITYDTELTPRKLTVAVGNFYMIEFGYIPSWKRCKLVLESEV